MRTIGAVVAVAAVIRIVVDLDREQQVGAVGSLSTEAHCLPVFESGRHFQVDLPIADVQPDLAAASGLFKRYVDRRGDFGRSPRFSST